MLPVKKYAVPTSKKYSSVGEIIQSNRLHELQIDLQTRVLINVIQRGYAQKDLCVIAQTNKSSMSSWLSGKRVMPGDKLKLIINEVL